MSKHFIDRLRIFVKAGSGAAGNPRLRGKGGNGGSVYLEAQDDITLNDILHSNPKKRFQAKHGLEASKRQGLILGRDGADLVVPVPTGITVLKAGQSNFQQETTAKSPFVPTKLGDLDRPGQRLLVAQGGLGGLPQTGYLGSPGQAQSLILDLKLMADYSLLGFPNAGKSSLLAALSNANVKIASYPFTTIRPQLADCKYPDARRIRLIDLPGLADVYATYSSQLASTPSESERPSLPNLRHTNFLKHVERSSCLLVVLDSLGFQMNQNSSWRSPLTCAYLLIHLLERWSAGFLLEKPFVCVLNKIDLPGAKQEADEIFQHLDRLPSDESKALSGLPPELLPRFTPRFEGIYLISASTGTNIPELKNHLRRHLDEIELHKRREVLQRIAQEQATQDETILFDKSTTYC